MKHFLKLVLLSCLIVFFTACEKDDDVTNISTKETAVKVEQITTETLNNNAVNQILEMLNSPSQSPTSASARTSGTSNKISVDEKNGYHITFGKYESYTFPISRTNPESLMENLFLSKQANGNYLTAIVSYDFNLAEIENLKKGIYPNNFSSKTKITTLNSQSKDRGANTPWRIDEYGNCWYIDKIFVENGHMYFTDKMGDCPGGGNSNAEQPYDMSYILPGLENGGGSSGGYLGDGSTPPNSTPPANGTSPYPGGSNNSGEGSQENTPPKIEELYINGEFVGYITIPAVPSVKPKIIELSFRIGLTEEQRLWLLQDENLNKGIDLFNYCYNNNWNDDIKDFVKNGIKILLENPNANPFLGADCRSFEYAQPSGALQRGCGVTDMNITFYTAGVRPNGSPYYGEIDINTSLIYFTAPTWMTNSQAANATAAAVTVAINTTRLYFYENPNVSEYQLRDFFNSNLISQMGIIGGSVSPIEPFPIPSPAPFISNFFGAATDC